MDNICLPVQLDTFILNEQVCNEGSTLIAPITLPNYVSLRLSNAVIQHDIIPPIDLHNAKPARGNPRVSKVYSAPFEDLKLAQPEPKPQDIELIQDRFGVYLHWSIPRGYRTGQSVDKTSDDTPHNDDADAAAQPTFKQVPNRWLLVRVLRDYEPKSADIDTVTAWVIESDRLRKLGQLPKDLDLETEVTPFVAYSDEDAATNPELLDNQAEMFIGYKTFLRGWQEDAQAKRVPLTTMNSSNPIFADYAMHNSNVFSTHDNFSYHDGGRKQFLSRATCDYVLVGWHSSAQDPLSPNVPDTDPLVATKQSLADRLKSMYLKVPPGEKDPASTDSRRLFCHAAVYNITYDAAVRPDTLGDQYASNFTSATNMEPVSVGVTPLDSILTFLEAHSDPSGNANVGGNININSPPSETGKILRSITELLYATEDTYDERVKAADLMYYHNFGRTAGGFEWRYDKKKNSGFPDSTTEAGPPAQPSEEEAIKIAKLNEAQCILDAAVSKLRLLQWSLFAEFFKYCSDNLMREATYHSRVLALRDEGQDLNKKVELLKSQVLTLSGKVEVKRFPRDTFFQRNDPTLCLAGIESGWPADYFEDASTRLYSTLKGPKDATLAEAARAVLKLINDMPVASDLKATIANLVHEASGGFQDELPGHTNWTKQQPFRPQFIEWEGLYYHVPDFDEQWKIGTDYTSSSQSNHAQLRYINPNPLHDTHTRNDCRHVSGRILILPQPSFALAAVVQQVLSTATPDQLPDTLKDPNDPKHDMELKMKFIYECSQLKFISGQLSGIADALVTMADGQHVKPNLREMGKVNVPMKAALDLGSNIGLGPDEFKLIDSETGKTPYGTLVDFGATPEHEPFKGVQGGQFVITKMAVIDKFGQAICAPPPARAPYTAPIFPKAIHPCLGNQLIPTVFNDGTINVPFSQEEVPANQHTESGYPITPFIQLTPAINQEARINSYFMQRVEDGKGKFISWAPSTPWENPVFGWVVINYADSTLQFFTTEGIFYTSVRIGGPTGVTRSHDWLPFAQTPNAAGKVSTQLQEMLATLTDTTVIPDGSGLTKGAKYLQSLWTTIEDVVHQMPFAPSQYSSSANAVVGKPLALVNIGSSLELSQPPLWPQYTPHEDPKVNPSALSDNNDVVGQQDPRRKVAADTLQSFKFKIKIGDRDRPFDGVVAYWDSQNMSTSTDGKIPPGGTAFELFYCYPKPTSNAHEEDPGYARKFITPASFPSLSPYFIDPDSLSPSDFQLAQTNQLMINTVLIDPYASIHLYTGILPTKTTKLPGWVISEPIKNMTAFFSMGPLLLTKDVPKVFDVKREATPRSWVDGQGIDMSDPARADVNLAVAGTKGQWKWLQPYIVPSNRATSGTAASEGGGGESETAYMSLSVGQDDGTLRLDPAPYTLVEGFLQLASPLLSKPIS